jgi:integral membrane protein
MHFLLTSLGRLRAISILEGVSLLVLLGIAMPLKYLAHQPQAVRLVGMAHGVLFISYVLLLLQNTIERRWSIGKFGLGLLLSVVPFGAFYAERKLFQDSSPSTLPS